MTLFLKTGQGINITQARPRTYLAFYGTQMKTLLYYLIQIDDIYKCDLARSEPYQTSQREIVTKMNM